MRPTLNGSSALQRFKHGNMFKRHNFSVKLSSCICSHTDSSCPGCWLYVIHRYLLVHDKSCFVLWQISKLMCCSLRLAPAMINHHSIDLIRKTISHYVIQFRMAKAHECSFAAVYAAVSGEAWRAVALGSFDSPRPQTWWDCWKKLLNDRNGRRQLIVVLVEVSSLLPLPKVATASKRVWMVYLLGRELGSLLRHGNPYCTLRPLLSFTAIQL